jgi:hypothetical protein
MERTYWETVQLLGLDIELAIVAVLFALEGLNRLVQQLLTRRRRASPSAAPVLPAALAWPPERWRSNP